MLPDRNRIAPSRGYGGSSSHWFAGIDLGTTNSAVALLDARAIQRGDPQSAIRILPVRQDTERGKVSQMLLPSVVAEVQPGEWWVGVGARAARNRGLIPGRQIFYSTKLEMGVGREPRWPYAASGVDSPYKVAGRILQDLRRTIVTEAGEEALGNLVVTVPASFQLAARQDTFRAASLAGMTVTEQALLDEPNAALLDYLLTGTDHSAQEMRHYFATPRIVLVFDFGGGTCDLSLVRILFDRIEQRFSLANIAISRYNQLGGDNIDAEIAEHVLLPRLLKENGLHALDVTWSDKKTRVIPQLLDTAEALKLRLCMDLTARTPSAGLQATQESLTVRVPLRSLGAANSGRLCTLTNPSLSAEEFERVLQPFLDSDLLYTRSTELNSVTPIFAPAVDVLSRAHIPASAVDAVLLVGGSSLIPQVERALARYFNAASILKFSDPARALYAVARGAALHSFFLHGLGKPLLKPIAQETIGILTRGEQFVPLIEAGIELPFPPEGVYRTFRGLTVPRHIVREVEVVLAADSKHKILGIERLKTEAMLHAGEEIELRFRLDANKLLQVEAELAGSPASRCEITLENPLCSTGFENEQHRRRLELQRQLAEAEAENLPRSESVDTMRELALLAFREDRYEQSIDWSRNAINANGKPDSDLLNLMGLNYNRLGAYDRAETMFRESLRAHPESSTVSFNLAYTLQMQGRTNEALTVVDEAIRRDASEGIYRAFRAQLLQRVGRQQESRVEFEHAAQLLDQVSHTREPRRGWRLLVAEALGDQVTVNRLHSKQEHVDARTTPYDPNNLPELSASMAISEV